MDVIEKTFAGQSEWWFHRPMAPIMSRVLEERLDDVTAPGTKPWGHLDGSASCEKPPSPPPWEPSLAPSCCTASSSHPAATAPPPASPACPLLLMPERRKQMVVNLKSARAETQTGTQPYRLQFFLFLLFTFWITAVRGVLLVLFVFLFLLLFHHLISVHLRLRLFKKYHYYWKDTTLFVKNSNC